MKDIAHFCQKCKAPNKPGRTKCETCGTRLMIVTMPTSQRHREELLPSFFEDHLIERVSLLELKLAQVSEQLAMAHEFISRQAEAGERDHRKLEVLLEAISEAEESGELAVRVRRGLESRTGAAEAKLDEIRLGHKKPDDELFTHLVSQGLKFLDDGEQKLAFRTLERAALLSPANYPLVLFIARSLFDAEMFDEARSYLEKAYTLAPHDTRSLLLLGFVYADASQPEKARKFLSVLAGKPNTSLCAHYIWGMLASREGNWKEALAAFKEALSASESPELFYLTGCAYFELGELKQAARHFKAATEAEAAFADAWFMRGVVYRMRGQSEKARYAMSMSKSAREPGAACLRLPKKEADGRLNVALPFKHLSDNDRRPLSDGAVRLTRFLQSEIVKAVG